MFNSDMLDVAIGLVFVYLLFSLVATAMRESLEAWLKSRGVLLEKGILQLLTAPSSPPPAGATSGEVDDTATKAAEDMLAKIYQSTAIFSLYQKQYIVPTERAKVKGGRGQAVALPAYIPGRSFAEGLLEVVSNCGCKETGGGQGSLDRLRLAVEAVPNAPVRDAVRAAIQAANGDPEKVKSYIEAWYASVMDRVSGWYRRRTQWWVLGGSAVVAIALNINTITIVQRLSENSALREAIVKSAGVANGDSLNTIGSPDTLSPAVAHLRSVGLPIGWDPDTRGCRLIGPDAADKDSWNCKKALWRSPDKSSGYVGSVVLASLESLPGWMMTALAISLGAPFWFDVLNKFMIVRTTVKPHEKSSEENSKDPTGDASAKTSTGAEAEDDDKAEDNDKIVSKTTPPVASTAKEQAEIAVLDPEERPREDDYRA